MKMKTCFIKKSKGQFIYVCKETKRPSVLLEFSQARKLTLQNDMLQVEKKWYKFIQLPNGRVT